MSRSSNAASRPKPRPLWLTIILWSLQIVAAAAFIAAGAFKLTGAPMMVGIFEQIGIGQWFRYVTGTIEIVSGLAIVIPAISAFGAVVLTGTMAAAVTTHLFVIGGNPIPAVVLMTITATVCFLRRDRLISLIR